MVHYKPQVGTLFISIMLLFFREFDGNDEDCTHLLYKNDTKIISSQESHNKGSSKLTLRNFVDFSWDHYYYRRQLIALNLTEQYVAYGFTKRKK